MSVISPSFTESELTGLGGDPDIMARVRDIGSQVQLPPSTVADAIAYAVDQPDSGPQRDGDPPGGPGRLTENAFFGSPGVSVNVFRRNKDTSEAGWDPYPASLVWYMSIIISHGGLE
ncbi:hypothetical protein GCM10029964_001360 [Kibdelosporangium lantanae]